MAAILVLGCTAIGSAMGWMLLGDFGKNVGGIIGFSFGSMLAITRSIRLSRTEPEVEIAVEEKSRGRAA